MKEIGQILKENRINQNKSIEDISNITKMNINIIQNLEDGNMDYFSNDLGYLRYYVKSYVTALGIEIENLEEALNEATLEYTQSITVLEQEKIDQINEQVKHKKQSFNINQGGLNQGGLKKAKKVDWTLVSLVTIVVLIASFLIYSLVSNAFNNPNENIKDPNIVDKEEEKPEEKEEEKEPEEEIKVTPVTVNMLSVDNIQLVDWKEDTKIRVVFNTDTWVQMTVNNQVVLLPKLEVDNKTFVVSEELIITDHYILNGEEVKFKEEDVIKIRFGVMNTNEFFIDDTKLELDADVASNPSVYDLMFTFGKKGN